MNTYIQLNMQEKKVSRFSVKNRLRKVAQDVATNKVAAQMLLNSYLYRIAKEGLDINPSTALDHYWIYGTNIMGEKMMNWTDSREVGVKLAYMANNHNYINKVQLNEF